MRLEFLIYNFFYYLDEPFFPRVRHFSFVSVSRLIGGCAGPLRGFWIFSSSAFLLDPSLSCHMALACSLAVFIMARMLGHVLRPPRFSWKSPPLRINIFLRPMSRVSEIFVISNFFRSSRMVFVPGISLAPFFLRGFPTFSLRLFLPPLVIIVCSFILWSRGFFRSHVVHRPRFSCSRRLKQSRNPPFEPVSLPEFSARVMREWDSNFR